MVEDGALHVERGEHPPHGSREVGAHLLLGADVAQRLPTVVQAPDVAVDAHEPEAVPHGCDDGVVRVVGGGRRADDDQAPGPRQGAPAVGPDVALPPAVVDLAQRCQHRGPLVAVHRQDGSEVLDHQ